MERKSPAVGITGGIGTGKSTLAQALARRGAHVIEADRIGHEVLREDASVRRALVETFGTAILGPDGVPDRKALAARVFGDPDALGALNRIVHPPLLARLRERLDTARRTPTVPLVVVDAALITEWGIEDWFDLVVVVTAPKERIRERLRAKGLAPEEIERRIVSQLPEEERIRRAGMVIRNDGAPEKLNEAAEEIWRRLVKV